MNSPARLVLDTNVWLDWLVFGNPGVTPLKNEVRNGRIQIAINAACLDELGRVLDYPQFQLDASTRDSLLAKVRICTVFVENLGTAPLPRCTDPDDQKFLELSRNSQAGWLITKDKALLKLRGRKLEAAGFRIVTPAQWSAEFESSGCHSINVTASDTAALSVR